MQSHVGKHEATLKALLIEQVGDTLRHRCSCCCCSQQGQQPEVLLLLLLLRDTHIGNADATGTAA
jgi:hypothetical protein